MRVQQKKENMPVQQKKENIFDSKKKIIYKLYQPTIRLELIT